MAFSNSVDATQSGFQSITTGGVWNGRTLTAGAGIAIANGDGTAGNPTISATGAGFAWQTTSVNVSPMVKDNGYIAISPGGALTFALPATAGSAIGDAVIVTLDGATSWQITQAAGQQIRIGSSTTTSGAGGSLASTAQGDTVELIYQGSGRWNAAGTLIGNITVV
jgi:hypothetical protein